MVATPSSRSLAGTNPERVHAFSAGFEAACHRAVGGGGLGDPDTQAVGRGDGVTTLVGTGTREGAVGQ